MDETSRVEVTRVAGELELKPEQVAAAVRLLDEGNTVPFITRYRKEQTGGLDEAAIRQIEQRVRALRGLAERAETILRLIDAQGRLTPALRRRIEQAESLKQLEDLYLPFRPKRRSRAALARERGLQPLADAIWNADPNVADLQTAAAGFVSALTSRSPAQPGNEPPDVPDAAAALQGAADIIAEQIGEDAAVRDRCRRIARRTGRLVVCAAAGGQASAEKPAAGRDAYRDYFDYSESVQSVPPHRVLAINRGEKAEALKARVEWDEARAVTELAINLRLTEHRFSDFLARCVRDAVSRLIAPSLEREIRRDLTEQAESHAIGVFARNLRKLLLQPPVRNRRLVAIDPGLRTGCKLAALDETGNLLGTDLIYVTGSAEKRAAARRRLAEFLREHDCRLLAIGNGTACRETEELVCELIAEELPDAEYLIVNEAGASVYSASTAARDEFPDLDATVRGTISIGRRVLDPLSELVKIEPQHIGVGLYQHDVSPRRLKESLEQVVESCVNFVGVDLNTASAALLRHVSGLNQLMARRVVEWREQNGRFANRRQLLEVSGIGEATFTQAAGFLKIAGGDEPLDATWIHPESYDAARGLLQRLSVDPVLLTGNGTGRSEFQQRITGVDPQQTATELGVGLLTFQDILAALARPGRDPRAELAGPVFKQGVLKLDDLHEGMELTGTVLNVVDFGAFVDVGLKDSGLVHVSRMAEKFVECPHDVVGVGDVVRVWVLGVDRERCRVSLSMVPPEPSTQAGSQRSGTRSQGSGVNRGSSIED